MTADASHAHHRIDYIELAATDLAAAKQFYAAAFGWRFTDYGPAYAGFSDGRAGEAGGVAQASTVTTGGPLVILYSHDLVATRDAVRAAGGMIEKDIFEFPGGQRFEFLDPAGNRLGVWSERG